MEIAGSTKPFLSDSAEDKYQVITTTQYLIATNFIFNYIVGYFMAMQSSFNI